MRVVIFCHSLISDWNHGNAHFLRGVSAELQARGHEVAVYEPDDAWSLRCLVAEQGPGAIARFEAAFPSLRSTRYRLESLDLDEALDGAGLVLAHEWNEPELLRRLGERRARAGGFRLLFHDTHHRAATDPAAMAALPLDGFDGVLAFGEVLRELYLRRGWARRAWTWHEAADVRVFKPLREVEHRGDLVWIGNWGDEERAAELGEFLIEPVAALGLAARVHGVRYPLRAQKLLARAGIAFGGWVPNYEVPRTLAAFAATVHVPRRPYAKALPGIPTIRPFEAMACGIPLVSAPWEDTEGLFSVGRDYLLARSGAQMRAHLELLLAEPQAARELAAHALGTIRARHTCAHRVEQLLAIHRELAGGEGQLERGEP